VERIERQRAEWRAAVDPEALEGAISVDEASVKFGGDGPRYGYCARGRRLLQQGPRPDSRSYSLLLAIGREGVLAWQLFEGAVNGRRFLGFLRRHVRRARVQGRALLMDNVRFHHGRAVKDWLERSGARPLYTPPYTPEYNPVELAFGQCRQHFRAAAAARAARPGDIGRQCRADLGRALAAVRPQDCQGYFRFVRDEVAGVSDRLGLRERAPMAAPPPRAIRPRPYVAS